MTGSFIWPKEITSKECSTLRSSVCSSHNASFWSHPIQGDASQTFKSNTYIICLRLTISLNWNFVLLNGDKLRFKRWRSFVLWLSWCLTVEHWVWTHWFNINIPSVDILLFSLNVCMVFTRCVHLKENVLKRIQQNRLDLCIILQIIWKIK